MDESLDILAFAPHPDDAEVGCGGSLILAGQQGLRVAVADLTRGEQSTRGNVSLRQEETDAATEHLGLALRLNLGLPDTEIGHDADHRDPLIQVIRETRPQIVLSPYWKDRHPDHAATGALVRDAFFLAGVAKVGSGKPYRPQRLYTYMLHHPFEPSFVIDISPVWSQKVAAIEAFASQFGPTDDDDGAPGSKPSSFLRFIEARAIYFGAMIGSAHGEAFRASGPLAMSGFPGTHGVPTGRSGPGPYSAYSP